MSYEIEGLSEEGLKEILKCLPEESLSHAALYLALRDGPEPIGRVFDSVTNNFLMELPKEARSPGYGFYCFWCNGKHYEFLRLESFLPDIVMRSTLPADFSLDEFLYELEAAFAVHLNYLTHEDGQVVAVGKAFTPAIKG